MTLNEVIGYQRDLIGTARGEIAIVGDFDAQLIHDKLLQLFPGHISRSPYQRLDREYRRVPPQRIVIDTPDKENAFLRARLDMRLRDHDPDAAALYVANGIFGGHSGLSSRLADRLRQKEGLSYSVGSSLSMGSRQPLSTWAVAVMVAPQNAARAEQAFLEELQRARRDGFSTAIIDNLPKSEASGVAGKLCRVTVVTKEIPQLKDDEAFFKYVKKTGRFDLMQRRLSDAAIKEIWDAGKEVPGIEHFNAVTLSINKI